MAKKDILGLSITQEFLKNVGGEHAVELVRAYLQKNKELTDEEIGKKLPLKITEIRTILNRLHYRGIACYNKSRNPNSGWYNYTWIIKTKRIAELILEQKAEEIEKQEKKIVFDKNYSSFACKKNCTIEPFEVATEYKFKCPECSETMGVLDSKRIMRETKKRIKNLRKEMKILEKTN